MQPVDKRVGKMNRSAEQFIFNVYFYKNPHLNIRHSKYVEESPISADLYGIFRWTEKEIYDFLENISKDIMILGGS